MEHKYSNIILPYHSIQNQLFQLRKFKEAPLWLENAENRQLASVILNRSEELFYKYLPYLNRGTNQPSWQWKFLAEANNYKGRVALGGNRIGKTVQVCYELMLAVTGKHPFREFPQNGRAWMIGLDNKMLSTADRPMVEKLIPQHFRGKFWKQDNIQEIKGEGREWLIDYKSTEMGRDKFQAVAIDIAVFDEEPLKIEIFSEVEARLIDRAGIWALAGTPVRGTAWLKILSERPDVFSTFAGMRNNPYLPLEEVEKFAKTLDDDERLIRIEGEYILFGGKPVFDRFKLREMMEKAKDSIAVEGMLIDAA